MTDEGAVTLALDSRLRGNDVVGGAPCPHPTEWVGHRVRIPLAVIPGMTRDPFSAAHEGSMGPPSSQTKCNTKRSRPCK